MSTKYLAILNGFSGITVQYIRAALSSFGIHSAYVLREDDAEEEYLLRLVRRAIDVLDTQRIEAADVLLMLLVSSVDEPERLDREKDIFFPATRRLGIDGAFSRDHFRSQEVVDRVVACMKTWEYNKTYALIRYSNSAKALLPVRNADCEEVGRELEQLYHCRSERMSAGIEKRVARMRGGGLRIGSRKFTGKINGSEHPVQRHSKSEICDFKGKYRLGSAVPERFEFDVECDTGVFGKRFYYCDGTDAVGGRSHSHVNVRINDDFGFGSK